MRRTRILLLIVSSFSLTGCDTLQKKHDSPVMVAAPRRIAEGTAESESPTNRDQGQKIAKQREDDGQDILQVRSSLTKKNPWEGWKDDTTIFNSQVAATVNGAPILNGDILERYADVLTGTRKQMEEACNNPKLLAPGSPEPTPEVYDQLRYQLIQRDIAGYIRNKLLVEYLKAGMKPEQLKAMDGHINELWEKEVAKLKVQLDVSNRTELELELNKKGTTLQNVKDNFALERLSMECIGIKSDKPDPIDRPDLIEYYRSHPDQFTFAAKVKWQLIQVSVESPGSDAKKKAAKAKLEQAIAELKQGTPFDQVARKYSDAPSAKDGGQWDWMEAGSLADDKLEKKLFTIPVNRLSDIHEGSGSYSIVKVNERTAAGRQPFEDVQQEIRSILEQEQNRERAQKFFKKVFSTAVIETQYSLPAFFKDDE